MKRSGGLGWTGLPETEMAEQKESVWAGLAGALGGTEGGKLETAGGGPGRDAGVVIPRQPAPAGGDRTPAAGHKRSSHTGKLRRKESHVSIGGGQESKPLCW